MNKILSTFLLLFFTCLTCSGQLLSGPNNPTSGDISIFTPDFKKLGDSGISIGSLTNTTQNYFWISSSNSMISTNTGIINGSGSYLNPYWGDYDAIIDSIPSNSVIHLLPGTFWTRGCWEGVSVGDPILLGGDKLIGSGEDITIIKRNPLYYPPSSTLDIVTVFTKSDNVTVSDLTVDSSGTNTFQGKVGGVMFFNVPSGGRITRVKAINQCGNWANQQESFNIFIVPNITGGSNNIIDDCISEYPQGTYDDGIMLSGNGIIENCHVYMPVITNTSEFSSPIYFDYSIIGRNAVFINNHAYGGTVGFYLDTGNVTNLTVINNTFQNQIYGIYFNDSYCIDGLSILNNVIELSTNNVSPFNVGIDLFNVGVTNTYHRITIQNNTIRWMNNDTSAASRGSWYSISVSQTTNNSIFGVQIINNFCDVSMKAQAQGSNLFINWNMDLQGNFLTNFNQGIYNLVLSNDTIINTVVGGTVLEPTNTFSGTSFLMGVTNYYIQTGSEVDLTSIGNLIAGYHNTGCMIIQASGADITVTNPYTWFPSDGVFSRIVSNGNRCILYLDVIPSICTNLTVQQYYHP